MLKVVKLSGIWARAEQSHPPGDGGTLQTLALTEAGSQEQDRPRNMHNLQNLLLWGKPQSGKQHAEGARRKWNTGQDGMNEEEAE